LRRVELDYQNFRDNGHIRDETVMSELHQLRSMKEINTREIDELRRQNEQIQ